MKTEKIYDVIGIGIGPFNLGFAALANDIPELNCIFFDRNESFNWHPGMMLPNAKLQVPFYADLVTLANPTSQFSYLAFLKAKNRLFRFAINENNFASRIEYNSYCRWVADQLTSLQFGMECEVINFNEADNCYEVYVKSKELNQRYIFRSKRIIIGNGTVPYMPDFTKGLKRNYVFHSSEYLFRKDNAINKKDICVIGSGQSAAEIFYDLLEQRDLHLNWFTRSARFYPMDYSKLALEMTSPDYVDHFYSLPDHIKPSILKGQDQLYKGINFSLIDEIYGRLYEMSLEERSYMPALCSNCDLLDMKQTDERFTLVFKHLETNAVFEKITDIVILATGYQYKLPEFIEPIKSIINWTNDEKYKLKRNYCIDENETIFVQNAELHSHGYNSADLGFGPYRNATILNTILGYERFGLERNIAFQRFG